MPSHDCWIIQAVDVQPLAADRALSELAQLAYEVVPLERIAATAIFEREGRFGWKEPSSSLIWSGSMSFQ